MSQNTIFKILSVSTFGMCMIGASCNEKPPQNKAQYIIQMDKVCASFLQQNQKLAQEIIKAEKSDNRKEVLKLMNTGSVNIESFFEKLKSIKNPAGEDENLSAFFSHIQSMIDGSRELRRLSQEAMQLGEQFKPGSDGENSLNHNSEVFMKLRKGRMEIQVAAMKGAEAAKKYGFKTCGTE